MSACGEEKVQIVKGGVGDTNLLFRANPGPIEGAMTIRYRSRGSKTREMGLSASTLHEKGRHHT